MHSAAPYVAPAAPPIYVITLVKLIKVDGMLGCNVEGPFLIYFDRHLIIRNPSMPHVFSLNFFFPPSGAFPMSKLAH